MSETPTTKPRRGTNWEAELKEDETLTRKEDGKERKVVLLRGLQRLAQEAGIKSSYSSFEFIPSQITGKFGILQCIYSVSFDDETSWTGAADCNENNTGGRFLNYPTAVAESRAEARCLRKALNIYMLSSEEVGFTEGVEQIETSPNKAIDSQVVKAIEKLCETRSISSAELLEAILSKERNSSIFELTELTVDEGQKAMAYLNDQKAVVAKSKKTAAEERAERKQELLAKKEAE